MNDFKNLKKGDKVIVCYFSILESDKKVAVVERITPTGLIRVDGRLYRPDTGTCRSNDHFSLEIYSEEKGIRIMQENTVSNTLAKLHQLGQLSYEQAVQIDKILTKETESMKGRFFIQISGPCVGRYIEVISEPFEQTIVRDGKNETVLKVNIKDLARNRIISYPVKRLFKQFQEVIPVNSERFQEIAPTVKPLCKRDLKEVALMDNESGFHVSHEVRYLSDNEFNDYSWGLYLSGSLIGYCTIGYADDVPEAIENYPAYVDDCCYLLSDVYVCPSYRNLGYGLKMIKEVIENRWSSEEKLPVFLECFDDRVQSFYRKAGFSRIEDKTDLSCMVLEP